MLVELRATNLALLGSVRFAPGPELTVLTGETGSGKTLCITALRLALGARVEGELIRPGAEAASATAVFDVIPDAARSLLEAHGVPEDELLTLCRELSRGGRGACRINGALVSIGTLRAVGEALVEVTAQGESHRLLRPARQRALLDAFGGDAIAGSRTHAAAAVLRWRDAEAALERAAEGAAASAAELAAARALVGELGPLRLRSGEDVELSAECRRLRASAALQAAMEEVHQACVGGEDATGAADLLAAAVVAGGAVVGVDAAVDIVLEGCAGAVEEVRELGAQARRAAAGIEVDASRLAEIEQRLDVLERIRRRFDGSLDAAVRALQSAEQLVSLTDAAGDAVAAATAARDTCRIDAADAAGRLSHERADAARRLERAVTQQLRRLRLPRARFRTILRRVPDEAGVPLNGELVSCTTEGVDAVEFRFTASSDGIPVPLDEGVSGGELSRVALAVRAVVALSDDCPTVVLDEVDTGLGGETAARVGETLAAIGAKRQLIVVTHRAEIAARAPHHVLLSRRESSTGAEAAARLLTDDERPAEIARLMSGRATAAAVVRATELLTEGRDDVRSEAIPTMAQQ